MSAADRRLLIKLMPSDTYSLELGRVRSRGLDFDVIEHVHDVCVDDLDRQVRDCATGTPSEIDELRPAARAGVLTPGRAAGRSAAS